MIFKFLKYTQPFWYFNRPSSGTVMYWIDYRKMNPEEQAVIQYDSNYSTESASLYDAAYQALMRGVIKSGDSTAALSFSDEVPLGDEYRFVRRHFHKLWSYYVFLIRLFTFRNPILELRAFLQARSVPRVSRTGNLVKWDVPADLNEFPLVTVVIPTLNRYSYLDDVISDLEKQTYQNFEVIIVDQSSPVELDRYQHSRLNLRHQYQEERALWRARNTAIRQASGDLILLYDDDSRVEPDWIASHIKCLELFSCDISAGVSLSKIGARIPFEYSFFRWSDQLDTGNALVKRKVFETIGLFDERFEKQRMGDGEYGLRAYLHGFTSVSNPMAARLHLKVDSGGLREMGSWDGYRPTNWLSPRPVPSVLYLVRKYFGDTQAMLDLIVKVPTSLVHLRYKSNKLYMLFSYFLALLSLPFICFQVFRSWQISTRMLKAGPLIPKLQ